jgi:hypothetical protein
MNNPFKSYFFKQPRSQLYKNWSCININWIKVKPESPVLAYTTPIFVKLRSQLSEKVSLKWIIFLIFLCIFLIARYGFSLKLKHTASNKTNINSVVIDSLYFPLTVHILNRMSLTKISVKSVCYCVKYHESFYDTGHLSFIHAGYIQQFWLGVCFIVYCMYAQLTDTRNYTSATSCFSSQLLVCNTGMELWLLFLLLMVDNFQLSQYMH